MKKEKDHERAKRLNEVYKHLFAHFGITPTSWYFGLNYTSGSPVDMKESVERSVSVPASYIGTTESLSMSIFGFSTETEWTTDISIKAANSSGDVIGQTSIENVTFKRNRSTEYSGPLFGSIGEMTVSLNDDWEDPNIGTW